MESINKNMPLISCIIGLGILILSILHFIGGVRTELKADMAEVKTELKADMAEVKTELKADMASLETRLNARMDRMETRLNARMDQLETNIKSIDGKLDQLLQAQRRPASSKITKKPKKASS